MMKKHVVFPAVVLLTLTLSTPAFNCTTTLTGKDASADGSVMVSHTDDGLGDPRVVFVPAMDHPAGALRPVFYESAAMGYLPEWGGSQTHRLVTDGRGPGYQNPDEPASVPLGYIPQVPHTYAYIDANYGIMNEHQVSIGECTDKAKVHPMPEPGKRIFYSAELSRVALERSTTAREAIAVMGKLIDAYGYYGTGETLLVADPDEGWVFEMAGYDLNGTDGVWVAQRVPDNGFFVAANQFRIREIREGADDMIFSANIFDAARALALWQSGDEQGARRLLTEHSAALADEVLTAWWQLADHLYITYNDGYINTEETIAQPVFYPAWWLEAVGYQNGPQAYEKPAAR